MSLVYTSFEQQQRATLGGGDRGNVFPFREIRLSSVRHELTPYNYYYDHIFVNFFPQLFALIRFIVTLCRVRPGPLIGKLRYRFAVRVIKLESVRVICFFYFQTPSTLYTFWSEFASSALFWTNPLPTGTR